jgi:phosphoglycolate phosphatase
MISPKFKTVLFDLDGTLIDSREDLSAAVNFALTSTNQPPRPPEHIIPHIGNGLRVLLSEVMGPVADETLQEAVSSFSKYYDQHCVDRTVLYPGVREGLKALNGKVKLGVVTNKPYDFAQTIIQKLRIGNFISVLVGGDSLPEKKPRPAPFLRALTDLEGEAESSLAIGDGPQDVTGGRAAGMKTCVAKYGYGFRSTTLDLNPDFTIDRFTDLKEIVL